MPKISLIGFDKKKYKSIKYSNGTVLNTDEFIKFYYGCDEDKLKPIIGKITNVLFKGVEIITDYGWHLAPWERIERVFKIKTTGRLKESKIFSVDCQSPIPLLDAAITRIIEQIKESKADIDFTEKKINTTVNFSRNIKFVKSRNVISIDIKSKTATTAVVKGLKRKTIIKLNKHGKISSSIIKKIVNSVLELSLTTNNGIITL